jgi:hypothetical protein
MQSPGASLPAAGYRLGPSASVPPAGRPHRAVGCAAESCTLRARQAHLDVGVWRGGHYRVLGVHVSRCMPHVAQAVTFGANTELTFDASSPICSSAGPAADGLFAVGTATAAAQARPAAEGALPMAAAPIVSTAPSARPAEPTELERAFSRRRSSSQSASLLADPPPLGQTDGRLAAVPGPAAFGMGAADGVLDTNGGAANAAAAGSPQLPALPPGWISQVDPSNGRVFYVEVATARSQWHLPAWP